MTCWMLHNHIMSPDYNWDQKSFRTGLLLSRLISLSIQLASISSNIFRLINKEATKRVVGQRSQACHTPWIIGCTKQIRNLEQGSKKKNKGWRRWKISGNGDCRSADGHLRAWSGGLYRIPWPHLSFAVSDPKKWRRESPDYVLCSLNTGNKSYDQALCYCFLHFSWKTGKKKKYNLAHAQDQIDLGRWAVQNSYFKFNIYNNKIQFHL